MNRPFTLIYAVISLASVLLALLQPDATATLTGNAVHLPWIPQN